MALIYGKERGGGVEKLPAWGRPLARARPGEAHLLKNAPEVVERLQGRQLQLKDEAEWGDRG